MESESTRRVPTNSRWPKNLAMTVGFLLSRNLCKSHTRMLLSYDPETIRLSSNFPRAHKTPFGQEKRSSETQRPASQLQGTRNAPEDSRLPLHGRGEW